MSYENITDTNIEAEPLPKADAEKWHSFVRDIYTKSQREGWQAAQTEFMASLINVPDTPYPPDLNERISLNVDFFFKHEFRAFFGYLPNIESIRNYSVKMVTATGRDRDDAYYVQATRALATNLGCPNVEFPGHMMYHFGCLKNSLPPFGVH